VKRVNQSRFGRLWPYGLDVRWPRRSLPRTTLLVRWVQGEDATDESGSGVLPLRRLCCCHLSGAAVWKSVPSLRASTGNCFLVMGRGAGPFAMRAVYVALPISPRPFSTVRLCRLPSLLRPYWLWSILLWSRRGFHGKPVDWRGGRHLGRSGDHLPRGDLAVLTALEPQIGDLIMLRRMFGFAVHKCCCRRIPATSPRRNPPGPSSSSRWLFRAAESNILENDLLLPDARDLGNRAVMAGVRLSPWPCVAVGFTKYRGARHRGQQGGDGELHFVPSWTGVAGHRQSLGEQPQFFT